MPSVLILEDEENLRLSIAKRVGRYADHVSEAGTLREARARLRERAYDVVITDVNLPDGDGVDLIREIGEGETDADSVVITAYGTVEHAVEAMQCGASDYLQKPVRLDELALVVRRVLERRAVRARLAVYERQGSASGVAEVVGRDERWVGAVENARRFAEAHAAPLSEDAALPCVLLTGETGTGKGVIARLIHDQASATAERPRAPFVQVSCAALSAPQVERELFGHEASGEDDGGEGPEARSGYFELADGGTIFLDEVSEMAPELQAKLLQVLERGVYRRLGGVIERRVWARVVAASNQDLERRVREGSFRQDLYYRLGAFVVDLPPLRDRGEDSVLLAERTLARLGPRQGREGVSLSDAAVERIRKHRWPGNARELVNAVQRALILCRGDVIEPEDLAIVGGAPAAPAGGGGLRFDFEHGPHTIEEVERALIEQSLERCDGNVTRAARLVGMPRGSFRYRMEKSGLTAAPEGSS